MATKTYDVDDIVGSIKTGFVTTFTRLIVGKALITLPFLSAFEKLVYDAVEWAVTLAATEGGLILFMVNNKIINVDKREDFFAAIKKVEDLPDDVPDEVWEPAEREASARFRDLFHLGS